MSSQIVLILGAGANIGKSLVQKFSTKGFKVAVASRTLLPEVTKLANSSITADFSNPSSIASVFEKVKQELGVPNVVIYNASSGTWTPSDPFSVPVATVEKDFAINVTSVYAAAQAAVSGFASLPKDVKKTFIFTGNRTNVEPIPALFSASSGKAATANLMWAATMAEGGKGYRFYYADERGPDGAPVYSNIDGEAASEFYLELAEKEEQGPWMATYVKGKGYVDFA